MDNNWIVENLTNAFGVWNSKMTEMWSLLTESPQTFKGGTIWQTIVTINGGMQAIGYGLLVLFFAGGFNYSLLLGGVWGDLVCVGNFFLMGKSAEKSLRRGNGKSAQTYMNTMYCLRYLGMFLAMTVAAFVPFIDLICAAVPLFFPKIIITLRGLWENRTRRSDDTGRGNAAPDKR